jgi:hypothetical protein
MAEVRVWGITTNCAPPIVARSECKKRQAVDEIRRQPAQFHEKSNRKAEPLRLADGAVHRLATLNGGKSGVDCHVDVLTEELHRAVT